MNPTPDRPDKLPEELTVRDYARSQGVTIQTAYRRIWDGRVQARQIYGRWLIAQQRVDQQIPKLSEMKSRTSDDALRLTSDPEMLETSGSPEESEMNNTGKAGGQ